MKRETGHTFRLDPTDEQRLKLAQNVGRDMGIACHVAASDGEQRYAPANLRKLAKKIGKLQSRRDRKQK